jgi:hypothetical protein
MGKGVLVLSFTCSELNRMQRLKVAGFNRSWLKDSRLTFVSIIQYGTRSRIYYFPYFYEIAAAIATEDSKRDHTFPDGCNMFIAIHTMSLIDKPRQGSFGTKYINISKLKRLLKMIN